MLYSTSKRMCMLISIPFEAVLQRHIKSAKIIGVCLLLLTLILNCYTFGVTSGVLFFCIGLMTFGSLIILLTPLRLLTYRSLIIFVLLSFTIEFIFHF